MLRAMPKSFRSIFFTSLSFGFASWSAFSSDSRAAMAPSMRFTSASLAFASTE